MINRENYFQYFKYSIYILLTINFYFFFTEDLEAFSIRFPNGISIDQVINAYATTIDTVAWLALLWILELETYVLEDEQITPLVTLLSLIIKVICYGFIVYAFFGYCVSLLFYYNTSSPQEMDLCSLVNENWSYSQMINEYTSISSENCSLLSTANEFVRFGDTYAIVDVAGSKDIIWLGWVDVINSGVWILVVFIIELNIRLQEKNTHQNMSLKLSKFNQYFLYPILFINAFYWGIEGDFVDFWDAFLWLVAFIFIELNIIQWRDENTEQP
tara:strand:+ start:3661 stop:4476 length:816 start_codon:yes stop_codon:yes gene_type:complete